MINITKEKLIKLCKTARAAIDKENSKTRRAYIESVLEVKLYNWNKLFKYLRFRKPTRKDAIPDYLNSYTAHTFYRKRLAIDEILNICKICDTFLVNIDIETARVLFPYIKD